MKHFCKRETKAVRPENEQGQRGAAGLSSRAIKWIALLTMLCDHFAKIFLIALINHPWPSVALNRFLHSDGILSLYTALQCIGRLAFPLFVFLLVEGFFLTRSRWNYFRRILVFALISEIPFDYSFRSSNLYPNQAAIFEFSYQNVLFTLAIGLLALILIDRILKKYPVGSPAAILTAPVAVAAVWLANVLDTDYHGYGAAAILIAYAVRTYAGWTCSGQTNAWQAFSGQTNSERTDTGRACSGQKENQASLPDTKNAVPSMLPVPWRMLEMALLILPLILQNPIEAWALADLAVIALYSGRSGGKRGGKRGVPYHKWFFYIFYPAHLAVLVLLKALLIR